MPNSIQSSRIPAIFLALTVVFGLASCRLFQPFPPSRTVDHRAVVPPDFLHSWDRDYNNWMDTPVRVLYYDVPLTEVFNRHPFTRLSYEFQRLPPTIPELSIDSKGITRRQFLWSIAHDNNLSMSLRSDASGKPETVIIRWRGTASDERSEEFGGYTPTN